MAGHGRPDLRTACLGETVNQQEKPLVGHFSLNPKSAIVVIFPIAPIAIYIYIMLSTIYGGFVAR